MRKLWAAGAAAATVGALLASTHTASSTPTSYPSGYNTWACGNTSNRIVLTFDDGPTDHGSPYTYNDVLFIGAWLKTQGIRGMFFLTTGDMRQEDREDVVAKLRAMGHYVGNHSIDHPDFAKISDTQLKAEANGGVHGNMLRPPFGSYTQHDKDVLASLGYRVCTWNAKLSTHDWDKGTGRQGLRSEASIRQIARNGAPTASGGVILGHLWTNYMDAVPGIVKDLHAQGRQFCKNTGPVDPNGYVPFPLKCT